MVSSFLQRYKTEAEVVSRTLAAILAGYLLTAVMTALLAVSLPLDKVDAVLVATMLSFAFYTVAVMWAFTVKRWWRSWFDLLLLSALVYVTYLVIT